jgi:beta-glucanase (GH16 family)
MTAATGPRYGIRRAFFWLAAAGLLVGFTVPSSTADAPPAATPRAESIPGLQLVFDDEFNGPAGASPNAANWGEQTGGGGWGNGELQEYTNRTANAELDGAGQLAIIARRERFTGPDGVTRDYTSARLYARPILFTYGYAEARIRLPCGVVWPAFWLLGADPEGDGWPYAGEVDVVEWNQYLGAHLVAQTAHGPQPGPGSISDQRGASEWEANHWQHVGGRPLCQSWHVYALQSVRDKLTWFVDRRPVYTLTPADLKPGAVWPFDVASYVMLSLAVGNYGGDPSGTSFPQTMLVDYVRVYVPVA